MNNLKTYLILFALTLGVLTETAGQIQQQRAMNWCWASCIQSCLYQATGRDYSQVDIAATLDGWPRDRPAHINEVVGLLQYYGFRSWRAGRPASAQELGYTLSTGWKLIAFVRPGGGAVGHFIILQGLDQWGNIIVSDPANGMTMSQSLYDLYNMWRWEDSVVVGL